ncbi:MAG: hypothetical protein PVJ95_03465, partial [Cellvibrionales bacterium]
EVEDSRVNGSRLQVRSQHFSPRWFVEAEGCSLGKGPIGGADFDRDFALYRGENRLATNGYPRAEIHNATGSNASVVGFFQPDA